MLSNAQLRGHLRFKSITLCTFNRASISFPELFSHSNKQKKYGGIIRIENNETFAIFFFGLLVNFFSITNKSTIAFKVHALKPENMTISLIQELYLWLDIGTY